MKKETVVCAALRVGKRIWLGHRHGHARTAMYDELSYTHNRKQIMRMNVEQGFITTKKRFVDRKQAYKLQTAARIKSHDVDGYRGKELFSEDLY